MIAHVIGQTPRPELTADLRRRLPSVQLRVVGALDGTRPQDLAPPATGGYPLETRLRDRTHVVLDAGFVAPFLQDSVDRHDPDADVHILLCAGPFQDLVPPLTPSGRSTPLIRPFDVAVEELSDRGYCRLDVMVPFAAQAAPAEEKWTKAGFACRVHVIAEQPAGSTLPAWVAGLVDEGDAEALVFDYVGFSSAALGEVAAQLEIPVLDLGHLALDALVKHLSAP